ncbi:hypothetical protein SSX86_010875 [Deinandra increscens subsp. villosa]|uniref:Transposase n=1 Tax=Deinandra increscens subsp. villosa TaxID=3103831 RepID=A0AAP0DCJ6_9ASTR
MEQNSAQGQFSPTNVNAYENRKRLRVQENQARLQALGLKNISKSLTSLVESDKSKKTKKKRMDTNNKDVEYMPGSEIADQVEQDYEHNDDTSVSKKKQHPKFIAPMSINRYANLAKKRCTASSVSHVLSSRVEASNKGQKSNCEAANTDPTKQNSSRERFNKLNVINQNSANSNSTTREKSSSAKKKLFEIDNDDNDGERDMIFDENNEEHYGHDFEDEHLDRAYEEGDRAADEELDDTGFDNGFENDEVDEEHERLQSENEAATISASQNHLEVDVDNNDQVEIVRKRVRGPTFMPKIWARDNGDRIPISFNEHGQPIDEKSSQLTHFMGALSRSGKYCPVHIPWNQVADAIKLKLIKFLETKFEFPVAAHDWILKSIGHKVKNWRARLKECYHDPSLTLEEQIRARPKQVKKKQWKKLVKYWNKAKALRISEKNKSNRAQRKMVQVTGKKSYARVREELKSSLGKEPTRLEMFRKCFSKDGNTKHEEVANAIQQMEELSSQAPKGSVDMPGPNDIYARVMGEDRNGNGDADMFGLGVRASDVWGGGGGYEVVLLVVERTFS